MRAVIVLTVAGCVADRDSTPTEFARSPPEPPSPTETAPGLDGDGDGFVPPVDCNDSDPSIHPFALEYLGDSIDADCDGGWDSSRMGTGSYAWSNPITPKIVRLDDVYALVVASDELDANGTVFTHTGAIVALPTGIGGAASPLGVPTPWIDLTGTGYEEWGARVDSVADGDTLHTSWSHQNDLYYGFTNTVTATSSERWDAVTSTFVRASGSFTGSLFDQSSDSIDIEVGLTGAVWTAACGDLGLQILVQDDDGRVSALDKRPYSGSQEVYPSSVCFWENQPSLIADTGRLVACEQGVDCVTYDIHPLAYTPISPSSTNSWAGSRLDFGTLRHGIHILIESQEPGVRITGHGEDFVAFSDLKVVHADAHWRTLATGAIEFAIAVVGTPADTPTGAPQLMLGWGRRDNLAIQQIELPVLANNTLSEPKHVAIHASDSQVALVGSGTSGGSDWLGWWFYGW